MRKRSGITGIFIMLSALMVSISYPTVPVFGAARGILSDTADKGDGSVSKEKTGGISEYNKKQPEKSANSNSGKTNKKEAVLSNSLDDYTYELDGAVMQLPTDYEAFKSLGWSLKSESNSHSEDDLFNAQDWNHFIMTKGDATIFVDIYNPSEDARPVKECKIGRIKVNNDGKTNFKVAGGIGFDASADEVLKKFGTPAENNTDADSQKIRYKTQRPGGISDYIEEGSTKFVFSLKDSFYNSIEIGYMPKKIEEAGGDSGSSGGSGVSVEGTSYLDAYKAPTELSKNPGDPMFKLDGKLYQVPCTLNAFLDNGWVVSKKAKDTLAPNTSASGTELKKGGYTILLKFNNFDTKEAKLEDCAVISVELSNAKSRGSMPNNYAEFPGGLNLGSSKESLDKVLTSFSVSQGNSKMTQYSFTTKYDTGTSMGLTDISITYMLSDVGLQVIFERNTWPY